MQAKASLQYLRISPRKVRLVADLVRGKKVEEAQTILRFAIKRGSLPILKLLQSALASAKHNFQGEEQNLYISKITVNEGPRLKRVMAMSRGQAYPLFKRTSHILIVLDELKPKTQETTPPAESPKGIQAGPPQSRQQASLGGKQKAKPTFETKQKAPKEVRGIQRIFRRKAI